MNKAEYKRLRSEYGRKTIDELVDLLARPDLRTRFFAEMALRDATST